MKKNKKNYSLLFLAIVIVLAVIGYFGYKHFYTLPSATQATIDTASWRTYIVKQFGYSIQYPSAWYLDPIGSDPNSIILHNYLDRDLTLEEKNNFLSGKTPTDKLRVVILYDGQIPANTQLVDWLKAKESYYGIMHAYNASIKNTMIAGYHGLILDYMSNEGPGVRYVFQAGDSVFSAYFGPPSTTQSQVFTTILSTFKIVDPTLDFSTWKAYTNTTAKYYILFPADYTVLENESYSVDGVKVKNPNTITLISPVLGDLKTNMQIRIHDENGVGNLSEPAVAKKIGTTIPGKQYAVADKYGYLFADTPLGPVGSTIVYVESGDKTFIITVESPGAGYTTGLQKYVDAILSTFHVTK